jgi:hypothetical protein
MKGFFAMLSGRGEKENRSVRRDNHNEVGSSALTPTGSKAILDHDERLAQWLADQAFIAAMGDAPPIDQEARSAYFDGLPGEIERQCRESNLPAPQRKVINRAAQLLREQYGLG